MAPMSPDRVVARIPVTEWMCEGLEDKKVEIFARDLFPAIRARLDVGRGAE